MSDTQQTLAVQVFVCKFEATKQRRINLQPPSCIVVQQRRQSYKHWKAEKLVCIPLCSERNRFQRAAVYDSIGVSAVVGGSSFTWLCDATRSAACLMFFRCLRGISKLSNHVFVDLTNSNNCSWEQASICLWSGAFVISNYCSWVVNQGYNPVTAIVALGSHKGKPLPCEVLCPCVSGVKTWCYSFRPWS